MSARTTQANRGSPGPPPPVPARPTLDSLRKAVQECRACDLWQGTTQAVMGEGAARASMMLVGEQPGDREDIEGHPFVGPAGRILDSALEQAHISKDSVYLTNVVKHFRYRARGKRRIHQRPDRWQIRACLPWLQAELAVVRPDGLLLLGATAAQALLGAQVRIGRDRGKPLESDLAPLVMVTTHPSAILRARDAAGRKAATAELVRDLVSLTEALTDRGGESR
jgi:uracil-DNA glycosylase family protein